MDFFDNNCPNGQFKCDILPGEYAVKRPIQAHAGFQALSERLAQMLENSAQWCLKCPIDPSKLSR
jgi:hypothetical protein